MKALGLKTEDVIRLSAPMHELITSPAWAALQEILQEAIEVTRQHGFQATTIEELRIQQGAAAMLETVLAIPEYLIKTAQEIVLKEEAGGKDSGVREIGKFRPQDGGDVSFA